MVKELDAAVEDEIQRANADAQGYKEYQFHQLFKRIYNLVTHFENAQRTHICTHEFKIELGVIAVRQVAPAFKKMHDVFRDANHPLRI